MQFTLQRNHHHFPRRNLTNYDSTHWVCKRVGKQNIFYNYYSFEYSSRVLSGLSSWFILFICFMPRACACACVCGLSKISTNLTLTTHWWSSGSYWEMEWNKLSHWLRNSLEFSYETNKIGRVPKSSSSIIFFFKGFLYF